MTEPIGKIESFTVSEDGLEFGARLVPAAVGETLLEMIQKETPYRSIYSPVNLPPLTRRQRLRVKLAGLRWRIVTAVEVLRGQHECWYD